MDTTIIEPAQKEAQISIIHSTPRALPPVLWHSQNDFKIASNRVFVMVCYRQATFSLQLSQPQPIPDLIRYVESINMSICDHESVFRCVRGMLITVDGVYQGPQDPQQFFDWKQMGGGDF